MQPVVYRLDGRESTLLLLDRPGGLPEIVHWGARLLGGIDPATVAALRSWAVPGGELQGVGPEAVLLPTFGGGLFRASAFAAHRAGRDWTAGFAVDDVEQAEGRLLIRASDSIARLALEIELSLPADGDVLAARSGLTNLSDEPLELQRLASGIFLLPETAGEILAFKGLWAREFATERFLLPVGGWSVESRRGRMSHDRFPAL